MLALSGALPIRPTVPVNHQLLVDVIQALQQLLKKVLQARSCFPLRNAKPLNKKEDQEMKQKECVWPPLNRALFFI